MSTAQKKTVTEEVYLDLRNRILEGDYLPQVHLVESNLIAEYSVSRSTIREALRRLTDDGLVEVIPHKGVMVRKFSKSEIKDMYEVLECLLCHAIKILADSDNPKAIHALEDILEEQKKAVNRGDFKKYLQLVHAFHNIIVDSTGNLYMKKVTSHIIMISTIYYAVTPLALRMQESLANHMKMLDAIKNHDADLAEALMELHLKSGVKLITDEMG